jgi:uncharacterized 2Fe-2S/4Fe-4S cluster protein (DUF4445 family)
LLSLIGTTSGFHLPAPCNGKGRCGKCRVRVLDDDEKSAAGPNVAGPITEADRAKLSEHEIDSGYRLACMCRPIGDASVVVPIESRAAFTKGTLPSVEGPAAPLFQRKALSLPEPVLEDQRSDHRRLLESADAAHSCLDIDAVRRLHETVIADSYQVAPLFHYMDFADGSMFGISRVAENASYALAVDIGTTTVAAYLVDLEAGEVVDVMSELNRQAAFGADVVSRIDASKDKGARTLQQRIVEQLQEMGDSLCARRRIRSTDVIACVAAGNTTMVHFLLGADATGIASAPFIPVITDLFVESASEVGLSFHPDARLVTLPSISGYVGADIVAAILAGEMHEADELSLLIDIGTNGEIVLGNRDGLICCSTAAGPAFEGAHIQHGVGGVAGAVSEVLRRGTDWVFQTIQGAAPVGVCGSGIVDAVSLLIQDAVLESTGRLKDTDELSDEMKTAYASRLSEDGPSFAIVPGENGQAARVALTQKDVREVQLAKAAIAAGVRTLVDHAGINMGEIKRLFLAGGFGSYIRRSSAVQIGLIPDELSDRVESIGNAAGTGVVTALLKRSALADCLRIAGMADYLELSNSQKFQDNYIEEMMFPGE